MKTSPHLRAVALTPCSRRPESLETDPLGIKRIRGFTLLELLVVIGLIVALVGGVGLAFSERSGSALSTAQQTLGSVCGLARAQAALHQTEARVFLYAERPPRGAAEKYLRFLQVYRADPAGSDSWVAATAGTYLPRGIYVVPPDLTGLVKSEASWPARRTLCSTLQAMDNLNQPPGTEFAGASAVFYLEFGPSGTPAIPDDESEARLLVATALTADQLPQFNNASASRGIFVRANGTIGLLDEPASL